MNRVWFIPVSLVFLFNGVLTNPRPTVTNEDIRDAILQVVNMVRATDDKLERHEYRERALGDVLKKGMLSIDKRIKLLEPFKGTVSRLDQRLAAVETILLQRDERERLQLQKTHQAVEDIQHNLPAIVAGVKSDILERLATLGDGNNASVALLRAVDDRFERLQGDFGAKLSDVERAVNRSGAEVGRHLNASGLLLEKYETKLAEYHNQVPRSGQTLDDQKRNVEQLRADLKAITGQLEKLSEVSPVNSTFELMISDKLNEIVNSQGVKHEETIRSVANISQEVKSLNDTLKANYAKLKSEIEHLAKVEQVMVQTADVVLDIKRQVEYGVMQVVNEVHQTAKKSAKDVNDAMSERFDTFEMSILDDESGALANISAKIGQEIDQVWRQIGIMHQQMTASTSTLNKLQNQTDLYVNGSLNNMDAMKKKVVTITNEMSELHDNLNYFMGKLGMVSHDFVEMKKGLGSALDEIRGTYKIVKDKIEPKGPGPHEIDSGELPPV